jgi:hypothetical protein
MLGDLGSRNPANRQRPRIQPQEMLTLDRSEGLGGMSRCDGLFAPSMLVLCMAASFGPWEVCCVLVSGKAEVTASNSAPIPESEASSRKASPVSYPSFYEQILGLSVEPVDLGQDLSWMKGRGLYTYRYKESPIMSPFPDNASLMAKASKRPIQ